MRNLVSILIATFVFTFMLSGCSNNSLSAKEYKMGKTASDFSDSVEKRAVSSEQVQKVINLIVSSPDSSFDRSVYLTDGAKFVSFQCGARTYWAYYAEGVTLTFWVRPQGSSSTSLTKSYSDFDFDGEVDYGIAGSSLRANSAGPKTLDTFEGYDSYEEKQEVRKYWQKEYEQALASVQMCVN